MQLVGLIGGPRLIFDNTTPACRLDLNVDTTLVYPIFRCDFSVFASLKWPIRRKLLNE